MPAHRKEQPKPMSARKRASLENLRKANVIRAQKKAKDDAAKLSAKIADLSEEIDKEVERQIALRFKDVDRKILKNEILQVFYDLGGKKRLKKFAKTEAGYKKFLDIMERILRQESDAGAARGGVVVNFDFGDSPPPKTIDISGEKID